MTKNLLFFTISMLMSLSTLFAATGSITVNSPSFPATITAGTDATFNITYTSDVDGTIHLDVFLVDANGSIDWNTWKTGVNYDIVAGTDVTNDYMLNIPADFNSETLDEGYSYILALSLKVDGSDFAYNNTGNILATEGAAPEVVNSIGFAETPTTEVTQSEAFDVNVNYSIAAGDSLIVKVSITKFTSDGGWIADGQVFTSDLHAPTESVVNETFSCTVDPELLPSSELSDGEVYKLDIGLYTADWGYLTSANKDITVKANTVIVVDNAANNELSIFPNPVNNVLNIQGAETGEMINIYSISGSLVKSYTYNNEIAPCNVSDLPVGIYTVQTKATTLRFVKK